MKYLYDGLAIVGFGFLVAAASFIHVALALALTGLGLIGVAVLGARVR